MDIRLNLYVKTSFEMSLTFKYVLPLYNPKQFSDIEIYATEYDSIL